MTVTPQRSGVVSAGSSPAGAGGRAVPPAGQGRLPGARSDRRPALAALAMLLVLGGALVSGLVAYRSGQRADYLVVIRDVAPGQQLSAEDLGVARIAGTGVRAVPASDRAAVIGSFATTRVFAGTLLTRDMVTPREEFPRSAAVVGVAVDAGQAPAGGLRTGDVVRILSVPVRGGQERPRVLVEAARVSAVSGGDTGGRGSVPSANAGTVVSVVVPFQRSGEVAAASAQRQAALVLLPPATRPSVEG